MKKKRFFVEWFKGFLTWKLYKVFYLLIFVPLIFDSVTEWIKGNTYVSMIYFVVAVFLVIPSCLKLGNLIDIFLRRLGV